MTSLKDVRLWLILALAVLCLIAVRNCTINYQSDTETAAGAAESTNSLTESSTDPSKAAQPATATSQVTETTAEEPVASVVDTDEEKTATGAINQLKASTDDVQPITATETTAETTAEQTVNSDPAEKVEVAVEEETAAANPDADATASGEENSAAIATASSVDTQSTQTASDSVGGNTDTRVATQTTQVQIIRREIVEFNLGDESKTGEFDVDLSNDIGTVQQGLEEYGDRVGSLQQYIEELRNKMEAR